MESSLRIVSASPDVTIDAGLEQVGPVGDVHGEVGVLLDEQHRQPLLLVEPLQDPEHLADDERARARGWARRRAAGAAGSSGRGRWPASAARRPTGSRPSALGARPAAGTPRTSARDRASTSSSLARVGTDPEVVVHASGRRRCRDPAAPGRAPAATIRSGLVRHDLAARRADRAPTRGSCPRSPA